MLKLTNHLATGKRKEFGSFTVEEILTLIEDENPLIEYICNKGDIFCISAKPKVGKSVFVLQLMFNLTTGEAVLSTYKVHGINKVLYIMAESKISNLKKRIINMKRQINLNEDNLKVINKRGWGLQRDKDIMELTAMTRAFDIDFDVIVFDPLYKLMHGGSLSNSDDVTMWTNNVEILLGEFNATAIVIHHDTEKVFRAKNTGEAYETSPSALFGSTFWSGFFTHTFKLTKHKHLHYLKEGIQRDGSMIDKVTMQMIKPQIDPFSRLYFTVDESDCSLREFQIREILKKGKRCVYPDVYIDNNIPRSTFHRVVSILEANETVRVETDENGKKWYVYIGE